MALVIDDSRASQTSEDCKPAVHAEIAALLHSRQAYLDELSILLSYLNPVKSSEICSVVESLIELENSDCLKLVDVDRSLSFTNMDNLRQWVCL